MQNSGLVDIYSHSKRHIAYDKFPNRTVRDDVIESKNFIKRINIPCEMTGKEIVDCINE